MNSVGGGTNASLVLIAIPVHGNVRLTFSIAENEDAEIDGAVECVASPETVRRFAANMIEAAQQADEQMPQAPQ